jgi:hypothetical protein
MTHNTYDPDQIVDMLDDAINQPVTYDINELLEMIGISIIDENGERRH